MQSYKGSSHISYLHVVRVCDLLSNLRNQAFNFGDLAFACVKSVVRFCGIWKNMYPTVNKLSKSIFLNYTE